MLFQVDRVRPELKCRTASWCRGELLGVGGKAHVVTRGGRSEVLCVSRKGDTQEGETEFFKYTRLYLHTADGCFHTKMVVTETIWPTEPNIFTLWHFIEKVCQHLP